MPGYLAQLMKVKSMEIHERHFALLRLAQLRQLEAARMDSGAWAVSSHSRPGHFHKVTAGLCSCEALTYCTHAALALDAQVKLEAEPSDYLAYMSAQREDFSALRLRVLLDEQTAEDKAFTRPLIERVRARLAPFAAPESVGCQF